MTTVCISLCKTLLFIGYRSRFGDKMSAEILSLGIIKVHGMVLDTRAKCIVVRDV